MSAIGKLKNYIKRNGRTNINYYTLTTTRKVRISLVSFEAATAITKAVGGVNTPGVVPACIIIGAFGHVACPISNGPV